MKTASRLFLFALLLCGAPRLLHAQLGCVNSPENPTALLGLVGVAGAALAAWRSRSK